MALPPPYLIVGCCGMLGTAWCRLLEDQELGYLGVDLPELDLSDAANLRSCIPDGTTTVINCTGYTNVDGAEEEEEQALLVNSTGVANLAARCDEIGAVLVHYSTDYVFQGATQPYAVDHKREPLNAYGRTKAAGEELLEASGVAHLLIRTSWVYAPWAKNFVLTMVSLAQKPSIKVVDDQRGRPTSAEHLARTSLALLDRKARGSYHITDGGECSWFEFAKAIMEAQGTGCEVIPCTSAEFPRPATRPNYGVLDLGKTEKLLGPMTPWQENLASVLSRISRG